MRWGPIAGGPCSIGKADHNMTQQMLQYVYCTHTIASIEAKKLYAVGVVAVQQTACMQLEMTAVW